MYPKTLDRDFLDVENLKRLFKEGNSGLKENRFKRRNSGLNLVSL